MQTLSSVDESLFKQKVGTCRWLLTSGRESAERLQSLAPYFHAIEGEGSRGK
jgi:hypothetical protein